MKITLTEMQGLLSGKAMPSDIRVNETLAEYLVRKLNPQGDMEYEIDLWDWFGLSYASFLVMPRVAMHLMPEEWQEKMAALLSQYDDTINSSAFGVKGCTVRTIGADGKLMKTPEELLTYKRPTADTKAELLK